ncbi:MAG: hypothetical protein NWE93_10180 [Candidatus Bathyarchaeota archaeon]|nr:hypothetical protein [Candidatus Bathyarchaeota archaeon]MCW4000595.1 hypothetical protein [Candidatus Bathyarchaeota archaeon]
MPKNEIRIYVQTIALMNRFTKRISQLPLDLQEAFLADLETAIEARLKVLEMAQA